MTFTKEESDFIDLNWFFNWTTKLFPVHWHLAIQARMIAVVTLVFWKNLITVYMAIDMLSPRPSNTIKIKTIVTW